MVRDISMTGGCDFNFLNHTDSLPKKRGWQTIGNSALWRYNLHYFDDLTARNTDKRKHWHRALINRWIDENNPGNGTGWDSYPTSLRIVNWIKYALAGNKMESDWVRSLEIQSRWLRHRLEWHLLGNHLLTNAKALCFTGCFFEGKEVKEWLEQGIQIIKDQLSEQILADGGHFELSPMYHNIILEDVIDLINLSLAYPEQIPVDFQDQLEGYSRRMLNWMDVMEHPDGKLAFFNDSAMGISASSRRMRAYAARINVQSVESDAKRYVYLEDSGFFRWESGPAVLIGDVGCIGPDYTPGHGHADILSFELSVGRQRVLVNSGTSTYEESPDRLRQRGTSAHNTVDIDGENSSEVWKSFRVARRAKPFDFHIEKNGQEWINVACSHDGYKRLRGRNIHRRTWALTSGRLTVKDEVSGPFHSAIARFQIHPEATISGSTLCFPDGFCLQIESQGGHLNIAESSWHPEFGLSIPTKCIEIHLVSNQICTIFKWD